MMLQEVGMDDFTLYDATIEANIYFSRDEYKVQQKLLRAVRLNI